MAILRTNSKGSISIYLYIYLENDFYEKKIAFIIYFPNKVYIKKIAFIIELCYNINNMRLNMMDQSGWKYNICESKLTRKQLKLINLTARIYLILREFLKGQRSTPRICKDFWLYEKAAIQRTVD